MDSKKNMIPPGWAIEMNGTALRVTKPDGSVSNWADRPATNGTGMYDLCVALLAASTRDAIVPNAYIAQRDLAALQDTRVSGVQAMITNTPQADYVPVYIKQELQPAPADATPTTAFLHELNATIAPVLSVSLETDRALNSEFFTIRAAQSLFIMHAVLAVNKTLTALIAELGMKHFGKTPAFNNTETVFWF